MADLAKLVVKLQAETAQYHRELNRANRQLDRFQRAQSDSLDVIAKGFRVVGVAAVAAAGALALVYKSQSDVIDATAKLSARIGVATEDLQAFQHAGELSGVSADSMGSALERMNKNIGDAEAGTGRAKIVLEQYGLANQEFFNLDPAQQFEIIGQKIGDLDSASAKAALSTRVFGDAGQDLINLFNSGSIDSARDDINALGIAMSAIDAAQVEAANDSFTRLGLVSRGLGEQITIQVAPFVDALASRFFGVAKAAGGMDVIVSKALAGIVEAVATAGDAFDWLHANVLKVIRAAQQVDVVIARTTGTTKELVAAQDAVAVTTQKIIDIASGGVGDALRQRAQDIIEASRAVAEAAAEASRGGAGNVPTFETPDDSGESDLEAVQQSLLSEEERLIQSYERRREIILANTEETSDLRHELIDRLNQEWEEVNAEVALEDELERQAAVEKSEQEHQNRLNKIRDKSLGFAGKIILDWAKLEKKTFQSRLKFGLDTFTQLTAGFAGQSRVMFEINKAASLTNAVINTAQGVTEALKLPWPLNLAAAASVAAAGAIQIGTIASSSYGGGGSATAPTASTSTGVGEAEFTDDDEAVPDRPTQDVNIVIESGIYDATSVRELIGAINDELSDGVDLNVSIG